MTFLSSPSPPSPEGLDITSIELTWDQLPHWFGCVSMAPTRVVSSSPSFYLFIHPTQSSDNCINRSFSWWFCSQSFCHLILSIHGNELIANEFLSCYSVECISLGSVGKWSSDAITLAQFLHQHPLEQQSVVNFDWTGRVAFASKDMSLPLHLFLW